MNENTEINEGPPETAVKPERSHKAAPKPPAPTIPPCPEADELAGDKTPAVIAWWFQYHPEAAAAKYKGRKFQLPEA